MISHFAADNGRQMHRRSVTSFNEQVSDLAAPNGVLGDRKQGGQKEGSADRPPPVSLSLGPLRTADGVSRSRLGVQSGVSRCGDDQIVTVPLVPLETAPESTPVPTSSSSPAATAAGGSGPDRVAGGGQPQSGPVRYFERGFRADHVVESLQAVPEPVSYDGAGWLQMPGSSRAQFFQCQQFLYLRQTQGVSQVLFVGHHQQGHPLVLRGLGDFMQLSFGLLHALGVHRVHYKNDAICASRKWKVTVLWPPRDTLTFSELKPLVGTVFTNSLNCRRYRTVVFPAESSPRMAMWNDWKNGMFERKLGCSDNPFPIFPHEEGFEIPDKTGYLPVRAICENHTKAQAPVSTSHDPLPASTRAENQPTADSPTCYRDVDGIKKTPLAGGRRRQSFSVGPRCPVWICQRCCSLRTSPATGRRPHGHYSCLPLAALSWLRSGGADVCRGVEVWVMRRCRTADAPPNAVMLQPAAVCGQPLLSGASDQLLHSAS
ncbi:hypothetical protein INR49_001939 [Caranx melampygus]|nr:hypothetical protein INR49_001939 [Caranx melampygus]